MSRLTSFIHAMQQANAVSRLPEDTALYIKDGRLTVITDTVDGKEEPYAMQALLEEVATLGIQKGREKKAESVLTALRNLRRSVEESYWEHSWSTNLRDAMERATVVLGRGY